MRCANSTKVFGGVEKCLAKRGLGPIHFSLASYKPTSLMEERGNVVALIITLYKVLLTTKPVYPARSTLEGV